MSSKPFPSDILTQARSVVEAWKKIDPALKIGEINPAMLMADAQQVTPIQTDIDSLDAQLTDASAPESKTSTVMTLRNMR